MKRREVDVFSLTFGAVLILMAGWAAFPPEDWLFELPDWSLPVAGILVGVALIVRPLLTARAGDAQPSDGNRASTGAAPGGEPEAMSEPLPE